MRAGSGQPGVPYTGAGTPERIKKKTFPPGDREAGSAKDRGHFCRRGKKRVGVTIGLIKKKRPGYFRAGPDGLFVPAAARGRSFLYPSLCDSWINDFTPFAGWETPFGTAGCEPVPDADDPAAPGSFAPVFAALCSGVVVRISQLLSWFFL